VLVSRYDHCLVDLLWRWRRGELMCDIGVVISNHTELANEAVRSGVEFAHVPVTPETRPAAEAQMFDLLGGALAPRRSRARPRSAHGRVRLGPDAQP
jgi:formyltetrahydrofolate deformylase